MDDLEADIRVQAVQSVREDLALEALFRDLGMEVSADDLEAELQEIAESTGTSVEDARKRWQELGLMAVITEQIMHRKTVQWLLENATVTIEEAPDEEVVSEGTKKKAAKKPAAKKAAAATEDTADASEE
jgi:trigger factor